jgi:hypothetical protein
MNLQVLRWLIQHRSVLSQVLEACKGWSNDLTTSQRWEIIDRVARLVLPVLEKEQKSVAAMTIEFEYEEESDVAEAFKLGVEAQSLGIDWKTLVELILPIVVALLEAIARTK